jgi:aldehyde:ferredoxin oxidoreductase
VQGGDHTSTAALPLDGGGSELMEIFNDSGVYCNFNSFGIPRKVRFNFYEAITGIKLTPNEWYKSKALRILQIRFSEAWTRKLMNILKNSVSLSFA